MWWLTLRLADIKIEFFESESSTKRVINGTKATHNLALTVVTRSEPPTTSFLFFKLEDRDFH